MPVDGFVFCLLSFCEFNILGLFVSDSNLMMRQSTADATLISGSLNYCIYDYLGNRNLVFDASINSILTFNDYSGIIMQIVK